MHPTTLGPQKKRPVFEDSEGFQSRRTRLLRLPSSPYLPPGSFVCPSVLDETGRGHRTEMTRVAYKSLSVRFLFSPSVDLQVGTTRYLCHLTRSINTFNTPSYPLTNPMCQFTYFVVQFTIYTVPMLRFLYIHVSV